jgi:cyclophilin family peptidyl-prolyl cis-trans isomerase
MSLLINASTAKYCFIDLDIDDYRAKLGRCAAFCDATDARYGFSSKDLRQLGGSELARLPDLLSMDHEWSSKGSIETRPPVAGNRIVVQLYWDVAPMACENFATLCFYGSNKKPAPIGESGKPLTYRNSTVHRVEPGFVLQAGDFVKGNGSAGESIVNNGKKFKDERPGLLLEHDRKGVLSMGNSGKNSNSSQFFLTFGPTPRCNGKHVIFGKMVSGFSVLDYVETFGSKDGTPTAPVTITDCGLFDPLTTPGAGYWYDQPDEEAYSGISPVFMVRPRVTLVAPSQGVVERFVKALGTHVDVVASLIVEREGDSASVHARLKELLTDFGIDVVLVAPACKETIVSLEIPSYWASIGGAEEVLLESKPVGALAAVRTQSWLSKRPQWHLDGA